MYKLLPFQNRLWSRFIKKIKWLILYKMIILRVCINDEKFLLSRFKANQKKRLDLLEMTWERDGDEMELHDDAPMKVTM
jgi:hypothetical protein